MQIFALACEADIAAQALCDKHIGKAALEAVQILNDAYHVRRQQRLRRLTGLVFQTDAQFARESFLTNIKDMHKTDLPYKPYNPKHPLVKWAAKGVLQREWLASYAAECCLEYSRRYGRVHKCQEALVKVLRFPDNAMTSNAVKNAGRLVKRLYEFEFCREGIPEEYRDTSIGIIHNYRRYYFEAKKHFAKWEKGRPPPAWWPGSDIAPKPGIIAPEDKNAAQTDDIFSHPRTEYRAERFPPKGGIRIGED